VREILQLWGSGGVRAGFRAGVIVRVSHRRFYSMFGVSLPIPAPSFDILPIIILLASTLTLWRIPVIYYYHFPENNHQGHREWRFREQGRRNAALVVTVSL